MGIGDCATSGISRSRYSCRRTFASTAGKSIDTFDMQKVLATIAKAKYFSLGIGNGIASAEAHYDDLLIYDRALTADDIKALYTMERQVNNFTPSSPSPIFALPTQAASGTPPLSPGKWFDLTGREIAKPTRPGIYLHNGRKIFIR